MRLPRTEGFVEIVRGGFDHPIDLDIQVVAGRFSGAVSNVFPSNGHEFLRVLDALKRLRHGRAVLSGTDSFEFAVSWHGLTGNFWVEVKINQFAAFKDHRRQTQELTVLLAIDGEYWSTIKAGMQEIFGAC